MSSIDERIVEMQFDNKQFERGAEQTISTLGNLKKSLNFDGVEKSFESIENAVNNVRFDGFNGAIVGIQKSFSALEIAGFTVINRLTNAAIDFGINMAKSLSIDNIGAGFSKYEAQTKAVQTILNNVENSTMADAEALIHKLMWYTDETSYSFDSMITNISKFTSAGIDLDTASKSMIGIANACGLAGVETARASHAMDGFSKAMAAGYMDYRNWSWIKTAGLDTKIFKQQIIDTAESLGILNKDSKGVLKTAKGTEVTYGNMMMTLSEKWLTSDVMNAALAKYADYTEEIFKIAESEGITASEAMERYGNATDSLGAKAFKAAQEAKTFSEAIEAVKDAVSSKFAAGFDLIFGNYEEAKKTWTYLANYLWDVFAGPLDNFNVVLKTWKDSGGFKNLFGVNEDGTYFGAFYKYFEEYRKYIKAVNEVVDKRIFGSEDGSDRLAKRMLQITAQIKKMSDAFTVSEEDIESFKHRLVQIGHFLQSVGRVASSTRKIFSETFKTFAAGFKKAFPDVSDQLDAFIGGFETVSKRFRAFANSFSISDDVSLRIDNLFLAFRKVFNGAKNILSIGNDIFGIFRETFSEKVDVSIFDGFIEIIDNIGSALSNLELSDDSVEKIRKIFSGLISICTAFVNGITWAVNASKVALAPIKKVLSVLFAFLSDVGAFISGEKIDADDSWFSGFLSNLREEFSDFPNVLTVGENIISFFGAFVGAIKDFISAFAPDALNVGLIAAFAYALFQAGAAIKNLRNNGLTSMLSLGNLGSIFDINVFGRLSTTLQSINWSAIGVAIAGFAAGLALLAYAFSALSRITWADLAKGFVVIGAVLASFFLTVRAISKNKGNWAGLILAVVVITTLSGALLTTSIAILIFVGAIALLQNISFGNVVTAIGEITVILVIFGALAALAGKLWKPLLIGSGVLIVLSAAMIAAAVSITIFAGAMYLISRIPIDGFINGVIKFASVLVLFGALAAAASALWAPLLVGSGVLIVLSAAMIAAAISVTVLTSAMYLISRIPIDGFISGFVRFASVLVLFGALAVAASALWAPLLIGSGVLIVLSAAIIVASVSLLTFGAALAVVAAIPIDGMITAIIGLGSALIILGVVAGIMGTFWAPILIGSGVMLALAAAIAAVAAALLLLGAALSPLKTLSDTLSAGAAGFEYDTDIYGNVIAKRIEANAEQINESAETLRTANDNVTSALEESQNLGSEPIDVSAPIEVDPVLTDTSKASMVDAIGGMLTDSSFVEGIKSKYGNEFATNLISGVASGDMSSVDPSMLTDMLGSAFAGAGTDIGKSFMGEYAAGLSDPVQMKKIEESATAMEATTIANMEKGTAEATTAGNNLAAGFANGIKTGIGGAEEAAGALGTAAIAALRKAIAEGSPSRITYVSGMNFDLGFANAINDYAAASHRAASAMAKGTVDALGNGLSRMNGIAKGTVQVAPTVRPIMDLRSVQNGSRSLDMMFTRRQAMYANIADQERRNNNDLYRLVDVANSILGAVNSGHALYLDGKRVIGYIDRGLGQL